jgi:cell division protein FtsL
MNKFKVNQGGTKESAFSKFEKYLKLDTAFETGLPVKFLPHVLFVTTIGIFYIGNSHYAEKTVRSIDRLKSEVDDLRAEYTTLKASQMLNEKQSEVAKKVRKLGIKESLQPPQKIVVEEGEY